jgi:parallel beta-helix repeat protein
MSRLGSYKNTTFNESQKFLVLDPSTSSASLVLASELVAYITPKIGSVKAESTRLSAENTDYKVGEIIQTSGATVVGSLASVYLVVAGGSGNFPMLNGNDLLVLIGDDALRAQLISEVAGQGASLVSMEGGPTVEVAVNNRVIRVTSRTEMKGYDVPAGYQFSLEEGGRSGLFVVKVGAAPADPQEGVYVVLTYGNYAERFNYLYLTPEMFGAVGNGVTNDAPAIQAAFNFVPDQLWFSNKVYLIDNSAAIGLTVTNDITLLGEKGAALLAASELFHLFSATSCKVAVSNLIFTGNGVVVLVATGFPVALMFLDQCDYSTVTECEFNEATGAGFNVYRSVGVKITNCILAHTYSGSVAQPFLFAMYLRLSDSIEATGNIVDGYIQGICGGGTTNGANDITGINGVSSSQLRNCTIFNNQCYNQLDHSIYITNSCNNIVICDNITESVNQPIKIAMGENTVSNNIIRGGRGGIALRNVFNSVITNNTITTQTDNEFTYGIIESDTVYELDLKNNIISNNYIEHIGTGISGTGILIQSLLADGATVPNQISNLSITGNTVINYGKDKAEASGIEVFQTLQSVSPATGPKAERVKIDNNTIVMPASTGATYGIVILFGADHYSISNNNITGSNNVGIRLLGASNGIISENNIVGTGVYGIYELADDASRYDNRGNHIINNTATGVSRGVVVASENVVVVGQYIRSTGGAVSTFTVPGTYTANLVVLTNPNAGCVVDLTPDTDARPLYYVVRVVNASATSTISVSDTSKSIPPESSATFIHIGSNVFVDVV